MPSGDYSSISVAPGGMCKAGSATWTSCPQEGPRPLSLSRFSISRGKCDSRDPQRLKVTDYFLDKNEGCKRGDWLTTTVLPMQIMRSIGDKRPTFLSDPVWRKVPYEEQPQEEFDEFLNILSLIADILSQGHSLKQMRDRDLYVASLPIIDQICVLVAKLRDFYEHFGTKIAGPLYWPVLSATENPTDDPERGKLFPIALHFPNLNVARIVVMYWTAMAMLCSLLSKMCNRLRFIQVAIELEGGSISKQLDWWVKDSLASSSDEGAFDQSRKVKVDFTEFLTLDHEADIISLARHVCQSVDYFMQEDLLSMGPALAVTPLLCIYGILENEPSSHPHLQWIMGELSHIRSRGLGFLTQFVQN
jgi:hypothetical protein